MEPGLSNSERQGLGPQYGQPIGMMGMPHMVGPAPMGGPHMYGPGPHMHGPGGPHMNGPGMGQISPQGIVVNQPQPQPQVVNIVANQAFGTQPVSITCQFCNKPVTTTVNKTCNCCTCCLCWVTGLFVWICIQCCRKKEINCCDATHYCPNCGQMLGHYESC